MCKLKRLLVIVFLLFVLLPTTLFATTTTSQSITEIHEAGTYPVVFQYVDEQGNSVTKTVYITILYLRTVISEQYSEGIDAHDIEVETDVFSTLTDAELITLTKAHAWRLDNGNSVDITTVTRQVVDQTLGKFQVTFATANGTATTVNVVEKIIPLSSLNEFTYFSFSNDLYVWKGFYLLSLFMLLPLLLFLTTYNKSRAEVKKANQLLYQQEQVKNN